MIRQISAHEQIEPLGTEPQCRVALFARAAVAAAHVHYAPVEVTGGRAAGLKEEFRPKDDYTC